MANPRGYHCESAADQLGDYRWLANQGEAWIAMAAERSSSPLARAEWLRTQIPPQRARLVLEQVELRERARDKFPDASRHLYTRLGLEQATDATVAAYKARRFRHGEPVADLCCGIGGDLVALAGRGPATGVERDPLVALLAEANLRMVETENGQNTVRFSCGVVVADAAEFSVAGYWGWHIDPDRRPAGRRTTRVDFHEPGPEVIDRLRGDCGTGAVKLAPAAVLPENWPPEAELEWISRDRQCRQLVAWFGDLAAYPGHRKATLLGDSPVPMRTVVGEATCGPPAVRPVGRYVFDPDAAVLAAGLLGVLAAEHGLAPFSATAAYLTGDRLLEDPMLACFEVLEVMPLDVKRLARHLRDRNIGRLEIKKRGVPHDPETLRRRLALRGELPGVLILASVGRSATAILARRCREPS